MKGIDERIAGVHTRDMNTTTLRLPATYARDWWSRYDGETDQPTVSGNLATLSLDAEALADLISDVRHYTDPVMRDDFMQSVPHVVRSAEATLRRLKKEGVL